MKWFYLVLLTEMFKSLQLVINETPAENRNDPLEQWMMEKFESVVIEAVLRDQFFQVSSTGIDSK